MIGNAPNRSYQNNHLIIKSNIKYLGAKAEINFLPFAIFTAENKRK